MSNSPSLHSFYIHLNFGQTTLLILGLVSHLTGTYWEKQMKCIDPEKGFIMEGVFPVHFSAMSDIGWPVPQPS